MDQELILSVSEFMAIFNQTLDYVYPSVTITGELANFKVSKNRWVYFDLKDDESSLKFFGTVYMLPGPLEEGMLLRVRGQPRLHNLYGFSINVLSIQPVGEGSLKKAAKLLQAKLTKEGLFDFSRKRPLPYPPVHIGLITSKQSAAYFDFIKILDARWSGLNIDLINVQVQGEIAPLQIVKAIEQFNAQSIPPDVLVIIRGGGSADDLVAFSSEIVTRAIAGSRVPTMVAIGHEVDISLAELASDQRASTPSNAAELLVPDRDHIKQQIKQIKNHLKDLLNSKVESVGTELSRQKLDISQYLKNVLNSAQINLNNQASLLKAFNPDSVLARGFSIVRNDKGNIVRKSNQLKVSDIVNIQFSKGRVSAKVNNMQQENTGK